MNDYQRRLVKIMSMNPVLDQALYFRLPMLMTVRKMAQLMC